MRRSLGIAQQRWLQKQLTTPEAVSADYFRNAVLLADKVCPGDVENMRPA